MKELKFKKKSSAFGCYGWSGESVKVINDLMADAGFDVINEGFRNSWNPDRFAESSFRFRQRNSCLAEQRISFCP